MENTNLTEALIAELITATYSHNVSMRERRAFREALRGLVRLAKAEQMLALRQDIQKASQLHADTLRICKKIN